MKLYGLGQNVKLFCPTIEDFRRAMIIYHTGKWKWRDGKNPGFHRVWELYDDKTFVDVHNSFGHGGIERFPRSESEIILLSIEELEKIQEELGELKKLPNMSKGRGAWRKTKEMVVQKHLEISTTIDWRIR